MEIEFEPDAGTSSTDWGAAVVTLHVWQTPETEVGTHRKGPHEVLSPVHSIGFVSLEAAAHASFVKDFSIEARSVLAPLRPHLPHSMLPVRALLL